MRTMPYLLLSLMTLWPIACARPVATGSYTETKVEWHGATAEEIADAVRLIAPAPRLAVIDDGKAVLYCQGSVAETQRQLSASAPRLPTQLVVSTPIAKEGKLPSAPDQEEQVQITWEVDRAKAASHAIAVTDIVSRLREIESKQDEVAAAQAIHDKTVVTPSGSEVPLDSLVSAKATKVRRPIVLNQ